MLNNLIVLSKRPSRRRRIRTTRTLGLTHWILWHAANVPSPRGGSWDRASASPARYPPEHLHQTDTSTAANWHTAWREQRLREESGTCADENSELECLRKVSLYNFSQEIKQRSKGTMPHLPRWVLKLAVCLVFLESTSRAQEPGKQRWLMTSFHLV